MAINCQNRNSFSPREVTGFPFNSISWKESRQRVKCLYLTFKSTIKAERATAAKKSTDSLRGVPKILSWCTSWSVRCSLPVLTVTVLRSIRIIRVRMKKRKEEICFFRAKSVRYRSSMATTKMTPAIKINLKRVNLVSLREIVKERASPTLILIFRANRILN